MRFATEGCVVEQDGAHLTSPNLERAAAALRAIAFPFPPAAPRTIALATFRSSRSGRIGTAARLRNRPYASARILVRRVPAPDEQQALQKRPFALASLSQRNARSHADLRSNGRSARAMSTLAPPTGPLSSTVSQVHAGCKQKEVVPVLVEL